MLVHFVIRNSDLSVVLN